MGRPIKSKFFGNRNYPYDNYSTGGKTGVGGELVVTPVQVSSTGSLYSAGATLTFSAPDITGGVRALGTPVISQPGLGGITAVTLSNAGSGYNNTATISITTASSVAKASTGTVSVATIWPVNTTGIYVGMKVTGTGINAGATYVTAINGNGSLSLSAANAGAVNTTTSFIDAGSGFQAITALTTTTINTIQIISYINTGSTATSGGDIIKQDNARRYVVQNAQGIGICKLSTGTLVAGQMHIIATDSLGATYWVTKLTARKAAVYPRTSTSTAIYRTLRIAPWTIGNASGTTTGTAIISLSHTN